MSSWFNRLTHLVETTWFHHPFRASPCSYPLGLAGAVGRSPLGLRLGLGHLVAQHRELGRGGEVGLVLVDEGLRSRHLYSTHEQLIYWFGCYLDRNG